MRGEHLVLFGRGQPRVQRHDLGAPQLAVAQRVGGVADLALTGEEHEDVAVALGRQFLDRFAHGVDGIAVEGLLATSTVSGR